MKKKNNKGFSLIELIIAIAILVILTGLMAPQFMRYMEKARESKDMQALDTVYGAVQTALADEEGYKEIKAEKGIYAAIGTTGVTLEEILEDTGKLAEEVRATIGKSNTENLWTSKSVIDNNPAATSQGANSIVFIRINKDLRVSVWIGKAAEDSETKGPVVGDYLDPTHAMIKGKSTTAGVSFIISK